MRLSRTLVIAALVAVPVLTPIASHAQVTGSNTSSGTDASSGNAQGTNSASGQTGGSYGAFGVVNRNSMVVSLPTGTLPAGPGPVSPGVPAIGPAVNPAVQLSTILTGAESFCAANVFISLIRRTTGDRHLRRSFFAR